MDQENLRYPYGLKSHRLLLGMLVFGVGSYMAINKALFGDRGLNIYSIIHLEPGGARIFWACLGVLFVALVIAALISLYLNLTTQREIVLRPRAITLPRHVLSAGEVTIPYRDIVRLKTGGAGRHAFFRIRTGEHNVMVRKGALPSNDSFAELYEEISARVRRADAAMGFRS
nr:hypothetical protein [uncultured Dongia sp.]